MVKNTLTQPSPSSFARNGPGPKAVVNFLGMGAIILKMSDKTNSVESASSINRPCFLLSLSFLRRRHPLHSNQHLQQLHSHHQGPNEWEQISIYFGYA